MTDARAIAAQLVDLRNVGTHKVVKLTLHVPEEHALRLTGLFGWPTMVNPVPVALARLQEPKEVMPTDTKRTTPETTPRPIEPGGGVKKGWDELSYSQQAGILRNDIAFHSFLRNSIYLTGALSDQVASATTFADASAIMIRAHCGVTSCKSINDADGSADRWRELVRHYRAWQREPEVVG